MQPQPQPQPQPHLAILSTIVLAWASQSLLTKTAAQPAPALSQSNSWRALPDSPHYREIQSAITRNHVDNGTAQAVQVSAGFERSNWATESVSTDPFYTLPENASIAKPGDILKIEQVTNASLYSVPPNVAISRILFQTEDFNGTSISASGYVLWPWMAHRLKETSGIPTVVWGHGTSGAPAECAPSHVNLWYQFDAPFTLALQGYAVVAPDYAGLGINQTADGSFIPHQWGASPAQANDLFYAVEAARKAWPAELSHNFVVMGHSQGGGAAWAAAERQARMPVSGYLGSIAASPLTDVGMYGGLDLSSAGQALALAGPTISSIFPDFNLHDWVSPAGMPYYNLYFDVQGCMSTLNELFYNQQIRYAQPGWNESYYLGALSKLSTNGGKPFAGPLLVLQGTADASIPTEQTTKIVNQTCEAMPDGDLHYATLEGADHVPTLYASQQYWLQWIEDRFNGVIEHRGCKYERLAPFLPVGQYQKELRFYLQLPQYGYETA
ncbi:MAG: hypothetical protein Q9160_008555 [Pyrenula sp. 1 TL-2023]